MNEGENSQGGSSVNSGGRQRMDTQVGDSRGFLDKVRSVKSSLSEMRRPAKPLVATPDEAAGITRYDQVVSENDARKVALSEMRQAASDARPENQVIPFSDLPPAETNTTPFPESISPAASEPFSLKPITPEKDEEYRREAANGYSPLKNEQGQPQIDAIRDAQTKQAELDAAAQVKAKREDSILTNGQIAAREAALNTPIDAQFTHVEPRATLPLPSEQTANIQDPGLFKLNPITPDQAAAYQKEAASGYTSQQIEQGQPKIDEIRSSQSGANTVSESASPLSESKAEPVGSLGLDQIRAHTKAATTLDERFQQGDQSVTREEAQAAALNRVGQQEAPSDPRDALLDRLAKDGQSVSGIAEQFQRGEQVNNIFTGKPFTQTELQSLMQRQAELGARPASAPAVEQAPSTSTETADPFASIEQKLARIEAKRTHVDSQDRKIRHERDKVFKDVLANASDEVQHKLAAENPAFRERYLKAKREELSLTPEQEVELYKQLATEGGLPRHRVVANAAERSRKLRGITVNPRVLGPHESSLDGKGMVLDRPERTTPITVNRRVMGGVEIPEVSVTEEMTARLGPIEDLALARLNKLDAEATGEDAESRTRSAWRRKLVAAVLTVGALGAAVGIGKGIGEGELGSSNKVSTDQDHELVVDTIGSSADLTAAGISIGGQANGTTTENNGGLSSLGGSDTSASTDVGPTSEATLPTEENAVPFTTTPTPSESISGSEGSSGEASLTETEFSVQTFKDVETLSEKLMQQFGNDWDNPDILVTHLLDPKNYDNFKSFYEMKTGEAYPTKEEIYQTYQKVKAGDEDSSVLWHLGDYVPQAGEVPGSKDEFDIYNADGVKLEVQKLQAEENGVVVNPAPPSEAASGETAVGADSTTLVENTIAAPVGDGTGGPQPAVEVPPANPIITGGAAQVGVADQTVENTVGVTQTNQTEENQPKPGLFRRLFGRGGQNGR